MHALIEQKQLLQSSKRPPRAREAANMMGISEAEYVALSFPNQAIPLDIGRLQDLLIAVQNLGEVMALTRNDSIVFEHHGHYHNPRFRHAHMILENPPVDLRLRINEVKYGFAVNENDRLSLQFFDVQGRAIHKIYLTEQSDCAAYDYLTQKYRADFVMPVPEIPAGKDLLGIHISDDVWAEFEKQWQQMTNSHQVGPLLKRYGLTRPQAYQRLETVASKLPADAAKFMLEQLARLHIPLLIFAPNGVCTQIHQGTISNLMETGPWFNVLDEHFHMHLNLSEIDQVWRVYKPSEKEVIESIEWFDKSQQSIAMLYLHPDARGDATIMNKWQDLLAVLSELPAEES
ncbi:ChuX/HutX family heme-like substrate-binding protein [Thiomicrorhabdus indica]|uniref:ChuX/HutX family heme-like substrate-binding protein n=1 Tax=Thiomicrorhabdus indica TaxID=2267253 RepID=UPI00102E0CF8|nr:ChuX/HutX family heme-like substrate-binding protein [Thiomicrorhabdus indica]